MQFDTIIYQKNNNILEITLNRPKRLNAINKRLLEELEIAVDKAIIDNGVKVIILTGSGQSFCAGADIREAHFNSAKEVEKFLRICHNLFNKIENIEKPSIAAIDGYALGAGCELALVCDIRIASERSMIGLPEIKMGFLPGGGGTQRLPRLVGISNALEMIYTGEPLSAIAAYRIGVINKLVSNDKIMDEARKFAEIIADKSFLALKIAKKIVKDGISMDLSSALDLEIQTVSDLSFNATKETKKVNS
jgi:enoyl-CoA hydratase/carnithine racemase